MLDALIGILIIIVAVWVVRRLLDLERGRWLVTLAAVLVGEACTLIVFKVVTRTATEIPLRSLFGVYALVTVFAMLTVVLVELIARPRAGRRPRGIPHPILGIRRLAGRTIRYGQVSMIAIRHGLLHPGGDTAEVRGSRLGRSLGATFEDAGGLFVKLGQAMAAQPQIVTRAVAAELARLQDQAAPADPVAARAVIEEELGPPDEIFPQLSTGPIGSASIAQTYLGRLHNGREVVVKVQRPGVRQSVEQDLDILTRLTDRLMRRTSWARSLGLRELVAGFAEETREELDFRRQQTASRQDEVCTRAIPSPSQT
jgi:ubiquinone biosynthesis protein